MNTLLETNIADWLQFEALLECNRFKTSFQNHHLGNIFIKSLHGGVTGAMIELSAEATTRGELNSGEELIITSSSIDYLRITKDIDLHSRANILRKSRRLSIVDVVCWQDSEEIPVARGVVTIKISPPSND